MTIIDFQEYKIKNAIKNINNLTREEICQLLAEILTEYPTNNSIPIVKLSKKFEIMVYKQDFPQKVAGKLIIDSNLIETYKSNKVILVNRNHPKTMQRFTAARELGYYLFGVLGQQEVTSATVLEDTYKAPGSFGDFEEVATNILLPEHIFCKQFLKASKYLDWYFTEQYLSRFFEVPSKVVNRKIKSYSRKL